MTADTISTNINTLTRQAPRPSAYDGLLEARQAVDEAISLPSGDIEEWKGNLAEAAELLLEMLQTHREISEAPGGLFEEVSQLRPELHNRLEFMRSEHILLIEEGGRLLEAATASVMPTSGLVTNLREDAGYLVSKVREHMAIGADILFETYCREIGGSG